MSFGLFFHYVSSFGVRRVSGLQFVIAMDVKIERLLQPSICVNSVKYFAACFPNISS